MRTGRISAIAAVIFGLAVPVQAAPLVFPPIEQEGLGHAAPPVITAASWILFDESTDSVLAAVNPDAIRAPASITKIMTVLIALELGDQDERVVISQRAADTGEREIGLVPGEEVRLGALLRAAMIHSANDAATAIAEHIGGAVDGFIGMMNERAVELGMNQTRFVNPHGLDDPGHQTTARDMLVLAQAAMERSDFRDIVRARLVVFPDAPDGTLRVGSSTNLMLQTYPGNNGIKTGFTSQALLTFVATAERDGRELYAVILGSDGQRAHFSDAARLFDYGYEALGIYSTITVGAAYEVDRKVPQPAPVEMSSRLETMIHLSAHGFARETPSPPADLPELPPPPVASVHRRPSGPDGVWGALLHWLDALR